MPFAAFVELIRRASPACLVVVLTAAYMGYVYAGQTFATRESVESLERSIDHGFAAIGARIDFSDADGRVRDIQGQIRAKEREIADIEMVLADLANPSDESTNVLKSRVFSSKQDLQELRDQLTAAMAAKTEAERKYRQTVK